MLSLGEIGEAVGFLISHRYMQHIINQCPCKLTMDRKDTNSEENSLGSRL